MPRRPPVPPSKGIVRATKSGELFARRSGGNRDVASVSARSPETACKPDRFFARGAPPNASSRPRRGLPPTNAGSSRRPVARANASWSRARALPRRAAENSPPPRKRRRRARAANRGRAGAPTRAQSRSGGAPDPPATRDSLGTASGSRATRKSRSRLQVVWGPSRRRYAFSDESLRHAPSQGRGLAPGRVSAPGRARKGAVWGKRH